MRYRYTWLDPNLSDIQRVAEGTSYRVDDTYFCNREQKSIRVFDNGAEVEWKCAIVSTLTITPLSDPNPDPNPNNCSPPNICVPPDYRPPGMVCLSAEEFSQIEGLTAALNNSACS